MESKEEKEKNKRKISIITFIVWIFLIVTTVILVIGGINKTRALEKTEDIPTVDIGNNINLYWSCKCENANFLLLYYIIEDYVIIGDIVESDNSYACNIRLNKNKINDMIDLYNRETENEYGKHCYNSDAVIKDEVTVYWNGKSWNSYDSLSFLIPIKLEDLPPSPKNDLRYDNTIMSNIYDSKVKFECFDEHEEQYLYLDGFDFYGAFYECFIVDEILENTEDKVGKGGGIIPKGEIPYKCTIRINKNKINKIIDIYNGYFESEYGKHYYYINDDISKFEETLYWQNHGWRQLNSLTVKGINSNTGRPIVGYDDAEIFTIPIREMTETTKEVTLSYDANIGENEIKVEVPESKTQIISDGELAVFVISDMIPVRDGYKFLGWSNYSGKNDVDYRVGENIYLTENNICSMGRRECYFR